MKHIWLMIVFLFLSFAIVGCSTDSTVSTTVDTTISSTLEQLSTPTSLEVTSNIVTFDVVTGATKYKISVENSENEIVGEYFISNGFDLRLILSDGTYYVSIKAVGTGYTDSDYSTSIQVTIEEPNQVNTLSEESLNDVNYVRWLGRTYYDSLTESHYFYFTASGFEVAFYGTELQATFLSTKYDDTSHQAYLVALVDGDEDPNDGITFVLDSREKTITLVSGLENGYHTVKLLKRSEAIDSDTSVTSIQTDGYFAQAPVAKDFKLQFIAASSSTGYGNLGSLSVAKSSANSDGLRAFAYLTAYMLDAEISIFSASGWGVTRGYNTSGQVSATQTIPAAYDYYAINASNYVFTSAGKWDQSDYVPDVVVVNLGTNDFNSSSYSGMSDEDKLVLSNLYIQEYTAFIQRLNNYYPDAVIIVAYGLMGEQVTLGGFTIQVVNNANELIGETKVYSFLMEAAGTNGNPYGSNYHPNVQTSMNVAEDLAYYISTLTGHSVVRQMIDNE